MSVNRSDLIDRLTARQTMLTSKDVELAVKTIVDHLSETLANDGRIEIRGFGSFSLHHRAPRVGRNPRTGASVELKAKCSPHFKPGKALRDRVNASAAHTDIQQGE